MKEVSFLIACREFFGLKPGQSNIEFAREVRGLDEKDKAEIASEFERLGLFKVTSK